MKTIAMRSMTAIALATTLSGCQSLPVIGSLFAPSQQRPDMMRPAPDLAGAQLLEEGRQQLANGQISAAVASFRLAAMDQTTQADAFNGLGVAYARLGRADLADRYFSAAIEARPEDMRFAGNLMRLRQQVMLARASRTEQQPAAAAPAPALASRGRSGAIASAAPQARRPAVIHIGTRADLGEPAHVAVVQRDGSSVEVAQAPSSPDAASAPVVVENAPEATTGPLTIEIALNR